jgi:hypothetical protein
MNTTSRKADSVPRVKITPLDAMSERTVFITPHVSSRELAVELPE